MGNAYFGAAGSAAGLTIYKLEITPLIKITKILFNMRLNESWPKTKHLSFSYFNCFLIFISVLLFKLKRKHRNKKLWSIITQVKSFRCPASIETLAKTKFFESAKNTVYFNLASQTLLYLGQDVNLPSGWLFGFSFLKTQNGDWNIFFENIHFIRMVYKYKIMPIYSTNLLFLPTCW